MSQRDGRSALAAGLRLLNPGAALRWWGRGLALWLPDSLRRRLTPTPARLVLEVSGDELIASEVKGRQRTELSRHPIADLHAGRLRLPRSPKHQVVLRLDPGGTLSKTTVMPTAAEHNLHQVVGFEIDRLTPFTSDKLYYDARVIERRPDERSLKVRFTAVMRSVLDRLVQQLSDVGLAPDVVDVSGGDAINLLPVEQKPRRGRAGGLLSALLWLLLLATAGLAALLPIWQQRQQVVELMPRVADAQRRAETAAALRLQLEDSVESSQFLLQKRQNSVPVIDLLNELTGLLPDNTWVEQLIIKDGEVQIRGQSKDATALIGIVEASPYFTQATFRSPVTPDRRTGADRFFLTTQVAAAASTFARRGRVSESASESESESESDSS